MGNAPEAQRNGSPVVLIASQIVRDEIGFDFPQDVDFKAIYGHWQYDTFIARFTDQTIEPAYISFGIDQDGHVAGVTMKPVSPLADFSYDYQDLNFVAWNGGAPAGRRSPISGDQRLHRRDALRPVRQPPPRFGRADQLDDQPVERRSNVDPKPSIDHVAVDCVDLGLPAFL